MLSDGAFNAEERSERLEVLSNFGSQPMEIGEPLRSASLPFNSPTLSFPDLRFCLTGTSTAGREMAAKPRSPIEGLAPARCKNIDVLVVGHCGTETCLHSPSGLTIIKAKDAQGNGHHIASGLRRTGRNTCRRLIRSKLRPRPRLVVGRRSLNVPGGSRRGTV